MNHLNKLTPKLRKAPQPPLSHAGAVPDSDRARKPPLPMPPAMKELVPGDRVMGLGTFGKPTGEFGVVEQANEDDAVVKWDDDGRVRLHQPWLKKVSSTTFLGTVEKIIKSPFPGEPEKVQIAVEGADPLYKEVRVENKLTDKNGAEVRLKERAKVEVT